MAGVDVQRPAVQRWEGIPLYVVLQERIEDLIKAEGLEPGDALPSEAELQKRFGVSRATVRQALATLERRGLLERQQGRGTFLRVPALERSLPELTGFSEHIHAQGMRPSSTLVDYAVLQATSEDDTRHFASRERLVRVVRLRHANDIVVGLHTVYVPLAIAERAGLTEAALQADRSISLYALLEKAGIHIAWGEEHLQARGASRVESGLLGTRTGTPVMSVLRLSRDVADQLIEVVRAVYLGDKYDYIVHLDRRSAVRSGHPSGAKADPRGGMITPDRTVVAPVDGGEGG